MYTWYDLVVVPRVIVDILVILPPHLQAGRAVVPCPDARLMDLQQKLVGGFDGFQLGDSQELGHLDKNYSGLKFNMCLVELQLLGHGNAHPITAPILQGNRYVNPIIKMIVWIEIGEDGPQQHSKKNLHER